MVMYYYQRFMNKCSERVTLFVFSHRPGADNKSDLPQFPKKITLVDA